MCDLPPVHNLTLIDVAIARAVLPVLVDVASADPEATITFENLILDTRERHAGQEHPIHRQIATSMGRRLEALRGFTQPHGYPDLSSLVVSIGGRNPLPAAEAMRAKARGFDWSPVATDLLEEMDAYMKSITPREKRDVSDARDLMSAHYFDHKSCYLAAIQDCRDEIIDALMEGEDVDEVFATINHRLGGPEVPQCRDPETA